MPKRKKFGGRQKGTPNKDNKELKEMILCALDEAGGVKYLLKQANKNPGAFMQLIGKVLPMTIAGDADSPLKHTITIVSGVPRWNQSGQAMLPALNSSPSTLESNDGLH